MNDNDAKPPVAQDEFPEFAEPPQQRPAPEPEEPDGDDPSEGVQDEVDAVLARLRRERAEDQ